jgi:hypothetical protein
MDRLRSQLPVEDRLRLEQHHDSVRRLERSLASGASCTPPARPADRGLDATHADPRGNARTLFELVRLAFECDLVRSVSFMCGVELQSGDPYVWDPDSIPRSEGVNMHETNHNQYYDSAAWEAMTAYNRSIVACFGDFVRELQRGTNSFADTVLVYGGPMSNSQFHFNRSCPFLLASGENVRLAKNVYRRYGSWTWDQAYAGGISQTHVLTTAAQAVGLVDLEHFGDPRVDSSVLGELLS